MFTDQLTLLWKIIKRGFYILGGLLLFIVVIEIIRALQTLASVHTLLAWVVGIAGIGSIAWGVLKLLKLLKEFPSALIPPNPNNLGGKESSTYLKAHLYYLKSVVEGLSKNKYLPVDGRNSLSGILSDGKSFSISGNGDQLKRRIVTLDEDVIFPALKQLDEQAEKKVQDTVRDTMVGVMLLPFKAADIYLVIYRNGVMFFELVKLYSQRPSIKETYNVFRDVLKMVATVNILSYTERFTQKLMASVPILDKTTDDIIQGTGAGILTTAVGKATIQRCRAYKGWNTESEIESYRKTSLDFLGYVKDILGDDVVPPLSKQWKQAWGYMKGLFVKDEQDLDDIVDEKKPKWKIWKKDKSQSKAIN
ncbi:MAG: DUF697 domain-containing protein [Candidatus Marinimicrobia bacterium]|nr:DUF697 domain-containing protein [Candidatus Neomarinimicrobiota bacterium]